MKLLPLFIFLFYVPLVAQQTFVQDYSVKYYFKEEALPLAVASDRNQNISILTEKGLYFPFNGKFLYPGSIEEDKKYRTISAKKITALTAYKDQFIYTDQTHLFSQAWAGSLFEKLPIENVKHIAGDEDFNFLVASSTQYAYLKSAIYNSSLPLLDVKYHNGFFWILKEDGLYKSSPKSPELTQELKARNLTSFDISDNVVYLGTSTNGYISYNLKSKKQEVFSAVPVQHINAVSVIGNRIWLGSPQGAFSTENHKKYNYYYGERWLPSNDIKAIKQGPDNTVLLLTSLGMAQLFFEEMTLEKKADYFEKQVRSRHIRNGLNASLSGLHKGNLAGGFLADSDNDGLWTTMYLASQAFRYSVTQDKEALQNCIESLEAIERLYSVNPIEGFPARSFERTGFSKQLADPERWQKAPHPEWDWKATTSSDEAIGHMFVFGVLAELIDKPEIKSKAVSLMDSLMTHIRQNNLYLVDYDHKPTQWGKWNPEYVNAFATNIGDRKLNSSNLISMLQTAYFFTKKEKYKAKAEELLYKHGYLENLMRPMSEIGKADSTQDKHAIELSVQWNHSDDEMYFLGYWGLYRYALSPALKSQYKETILDHWQAERPEKDGLWNIFTAITGEKNTDIKEAKWYLEEHPLDLINWAVKNSHRKDIVTVASNFRTQTTKEVLPPDERPIQRHNQNMFRMDKLNGNGDSELSAGDIWLLPYWLGRYLGVL